MITIRKLRDGLAGLSLALFGGGVMLCTLHYPVGTLANMGPGYVPRLLGGLLVLLGLLIAGTARRAQPVVRQPLAWRPPLAVLGSVVLFALTLRSGGLLLATLGSVMLASSAVRGVRWRERLAVALVLSALAVSVFVYGLGLPLPVWPRFGGIWPWN